MTVWAAHARAAHRQTGTSGVAVGVAAPASCQAPLTGRDDHVTEAVVMATGMTQATSPTRAAELMVYGKTLLATRTLQAVGRGGWR